MFYKTNELNASLDVRDVISYHFVVGSKKTAKQFNSPNPTFPSELEKPGLGASSPSSDSGSSPFPGALLRGKVRRFQVQIDSLQALFRIPLAVVI